VRQDIEALSLHLGNLVLPGDTTTPMSVSCRLRSRETKNHLALGLTAKAAHTARPLVVGIPRFPAQLMRHELDRQLRDQVAFGLGHCFMRQGEL
jgi:hypothetical protein